MSAVFYYVYRFGYEYLTHVERGVVDRIPWSDEELLKKYGVDATRDNVVIRPGHPVYGPVTYNERKVDWEVAKIQTKMREFPQRHSVAMVEQAQEWVLLESDCRLRGRQETGLSVVEFGKFQKGENGTATHGDMELPSCVYERFREYVDTH